MPDSVRDAARRAFDVRRGDVVIADLVFDSVVDRDRRADRDPDIRRLHFGTEAASVDLSVEERGDGRHASLTLMPPRTSRFEVTCGKTTTHAVTDERGQASLTLTSGLVSLVVHPTPAVPAKAMQTAWVRL